MPNPPRSRHPISRALWIAAGLLACGLGFLGILIPGMPATVFFIAAAACFTRSSERLLNWVLGLPRVGPLVRNYRAGLGMPRSAKVWASVTMAVCVGISVFKLPHLWQQALVIVTAATGAAYIWTRIPILPSQPAHAPSPAVPPETATPRPSKIVQPHPMTPTESMPTPSVPKVMQQADRSP